MSSYQNVIVGGGLAGGMVAQEYREQGGDGSIADHRLRAAPTLPPAAPDQGLPARREARLGRCTCTRPSGGSRTTSRCAPRPARPRSTRAPTRSRWTAARRSPTSGWRWPPARLRARFRAPARSARSTTRPRSRRCSADGAGHLGVIGGGFIGVEAAASARMKGLDVTMAVPESVVWEHLFGAEVARYFQRQLESHGVTVLTRHQGAAGAGLQRSCWRASASTPNIELAKDAGLATEVGRAGGRAAVGRRRHLGGG